jgi:hypothetical protein
MPESDWEDVVVADSFDSVQEARESWDFLMQGIGQFYRKSVAHSQQHPERLTQPFWLHQHNHYSTQLDNWRTAFQTIFAKELRSGAIMQDASDMLSIYFNVATVLLASSVEHSELLYDEYTPLFAEIIAKSQQLIQTSEDPSNSSRFTLDMGTILPLMVTATKCRDRRIRRQAIGLLWSKARREGLCYDTITVARLCAWLTSIEGEGIQEDSEPIPETARFWISYMHLSSEERWLAVQLTSATTKDNGDHTYRETTFSW